MSRYNDLELRWDRMSEEERCLAYGKAVLADARRRDKLRPRERNVSNMLHEMQVTYIYGGGSR